MKNYKLCQKKKKKLRSEAAVIVEREYMNIESEEESLNIKDINLLVRFDKT